MKSILASVFLLFLNQSYTQSVIEDTSFNILKYLQTKYPKKYNYRDNEMIEYSDKCNCNVAYLTGGNYYYQEVKNIKEEIIGYNILGAYIPEGSGHDGSYGQNINDPHFISKKTKQVVADFFLQNQVNYRHNILIKPELKWVYREGISFSINSLTVIGNYNQKQASILFTLDNTNRDESSKIENIELLNQSIENVDTTDLTFIFTTNNTRDPKGIINSKGEIIFENIFTEVIYLKRKNNIDYFLVKKSSSDGYRSSEKFGIAKSNGSYVFEPNFSVLETDGYNLNRYGVGMIQYKGKFGLIDKDYNIVVDPNYDELQIIDGPKKVAIVKIRGDGYQKKERWDFFNIDTKKELGLNLQEIKNTTDAEIAIKLNNKWGFCNQSGQIIIQPKYSFVTSFNDGVAFVSLQGYTNNRVNNTSLLINKTGTTIAALNKDLGDDIASVGTFTDGLLLFRSRKTGLYGFINTKGVLSIPPTFESVEPFINGKSYVRKFGTGYYIDKKGNKINE